MFNYIKRPIIINMIFGVFFIHDFFTVADGYQTFIIKINYAISL